MENSLVYTNIRFLLHLKDAPASERKNMLMNMLPRQIEAVSEVAVKIVNGIVSPMRRDAQLFRRKRQLLRTLASKDVSITRKKSLLRRHHSMIPVLLKTLYLIQVIQHEVSTRRET